MKLNITCDVCDKLVDSWRICENVEDRGWSVMVGCHGETDRCFIGVDDVARAGPDMDWTKGRAFAGQKAPSSDIPFLRPPAMDPDTRDMLDVIESARGRFARLTSIPNSVLITYSNPRPDCWVDAVIKYGKD